MQRSGLWSHPFSLDRALGEARWMLAGSWRRAAVRHSPDDRNQTRDPSCASAGKNLSQLWYCTVA